MNYYRHIQFCNQWNTSGFMPFVVDNQQMGWMRHAFADELRRFPVVFTVESERVLLNPNLQEFEARNVGVAQVLEDLVADGVLSHVMGELFPVISQWGAKPAFLLDRAAVSAFGTRSYGQHLNGIVSTESGVSMWIGRRAADRHIFPDQLDQMVAGGLPHGIDPLDNLAKECEEEAGMDALLASRAVATGHVSYRRESEKGLRTDTIFCYDIVLPSDFVPENTDGEVSEFYLWSLDEVARVVRETDEFKPNCNLVVIDFLIRHGLIDKNHAEYNDLISGLQKIPM